MRVYPGIDASYRMGNWKLYASYNSSLRMPSVTELFYSVGGYKADKYLHPEELSALETGLKYDDKGITAKASLYWNHHRNLIDWISDGTKDANGALVWKSMNFGTINDFGLHTPAQPLAQPRPRSELPIPAPHGKLHRHEQRAARLQKLRHC